MNTIDTDPYFCKLLSRIAEFGFTGEHDKALIAYIYAKLAQAQADADLRYKELAELHEHMLDKLQESESRLAEIQRGVEGLERASPMLDQVFEVAGMQSNPGGSWINRKQVLALLQPQGQADTSGLSG